MIGKVHAAMQQDDHRSFLPTLRATVKPAMNDIVCRELARSRRGKAEVQSGGIGIALNLCQLAFGRKEVRPFQELERFLQPHISITVAGLAHGHRLND